jgi:hypothetical protein
MEEKLSDNICKEAFYEFYVNKNYQESLIKSKRVLRLLMKNNNINTKDDFYIWMILMIIVQSYDKLNQLKKAYRYIHLSIHYGKMEYMKVESLYYLIKYYIKINDNTKTELYFYKLVISCNKIGEYQILERILDIKV